MKTFKKTIALLLAISMVFSFAACTKKDPEPVNPKPVDPNPPVVDPVPVEPEILPEFKLSLEEFPKIDGATAMLPYYQEMAARVLGVTTDEAKKYVLCSTTSQAYINLIEGKVDMIFCAPPSEDQLKYAKSLGVEMESREVLNSGFVFFVNKSNPVNNLTSQQLHDIYAGKITNWKEVGGNDEEIIAYQRSEGSGSQTGLYEHVIRQSEVAAPPMEQKIGEMAAIIDVVSAYDNSKGGIGYSYYYYVTNMHYQEDVKLLSIDNVYPTSETISAGLYPYISKTAVWFNSKQPADSPVRQIAEYCSGKGGYQMAEDLGYVPSKDSSFVIPAYETAKKVHDFVPSYSINNVIQNTVEDTEANVYSSYVQIDGLKDAAVQEKINSTIKAEYEKLKNAVYEDNSVGSAHTPYDAIFVDGIGSYVTANFNNVLSLYLWATYRLENADSASSQYGNYSYDQKMVPLTFNLNTGNLLKFTDFFDNKSNGMTYVNSLVWEAINRNGGTENVYLEFEDELMIAAPFTGIKEDQKFYVSDFAGKIYLIFDEDTSEFYVPNGVQTFPIALQYYGNLEKYLSKTVLFTDETVKKGLITREINVGSEYGGEEYRELIGDRHISYWHRFDVSDDISTTASEYANGKEEKAKELIEKAIEIYDANKDVLSDINIDASYTTSIMTLGNYDTVAEYRYIYLYYSGGYSTNFKDFNFTKYHCFRKGSNEELLFVDIFKEGVDARDAIKKALLNKFNNPDFNTQQLGLDQPGLEAFVEAAVHDIDGFGILAGSIELSYTQLSDIILRFLEVPEQYFDNYKFMMQGLDFRSFEPDVLDIFN